MSGVGALPNGREAIRQALAGYNFGTLPNMAEAIQADPGPLLAALAEAGVLREESRDLHDGPLEKVWLTDRVYFNQRAVAGQERRYVTGWRRDA